MRLLLDAPADDIEVALERRPRPPTRRSHSMICSISGRVALAFSPMQRDVDRHLAPAIDAVAEVQDFGLDDLPAAFLRVEIGARQEDHADGDRAGA